MQGQASIYTIYTTPDDDFGPFPGRAKLLSDQNIVCSRVCVFTICNESKYNYSVLSLCLLDTAWFRPSGILLSLSCL